MTENPAQINASAPLPRVRDPQYREIYSNISQANMGPFDITMMFQKASEIAPTQIGVTDQVAVTMSPQHFKAYVRSLNETLTAYEKAFGKLTISDIETTPTQNAAQILERVHAARKQARTNPSSTEPKPPAKR